MSTPVRRAGSPPDAPVRQESLRAHNLALVFRQIVAAGGRPISRIELAETTGLARPTISRIVEELISGRLITESGAAPYAGAGRPRVGLVLSRRGPAGLGLDIRGDCLAACVVDVTGAVRHLAFRAGEQPGRPAPAVLADLAELAREAVLAAATEELSVVGGTLAVPGAVQDGSLVRFAPPLDWREVDAGAGLRRALGDAGLPLAVENEANLAARGELSASDEPLTDFAYVSGSLGLGAGIVLDSRLLRGARGWSGELGHVTIHPDGNPCPCGSRGCLRTYAGLEVIAGDGPAPVSSVLALADTGAPEVLGRLDVAGTALGIALADLVNLLDLDTILLGGGYAVLASWLTDRIEEQLRQRVVSAGWAGVEVRPALLGPDAAVIGAALTALDEVRQHPAAWLSGARAS
nr:ROK family protein [Micromonospora sp. DSM 115978]